MLESIKDEDFVFESEITPYITDPDENEPLLIEKIEDKVYSVEGPRVERMLGYTNLESEKGFMFFQNFIKEQGVIERLLELGMEEGDTVRVYGHEFEYYK